MSTRARSAWDVYIGTEALPAYICLINSPFSLMIASELALLSPQQPSGAVSVAVAFVMFLPGVEAGLLPGVRGVWCCCGCSLNDEEAVVGVGAPGVTGFLCNTPCRDLKGNTQLS